MEEQKPAEMAQKRREEQQLSETPRVVQEQQPTENTLMWRSSALVQNHAERAPNWREEQEQQLVEQAQKRREARQPVERAQRCAAE